MRKKRMEFPMEVKSGSVIVKIYKVENKGRDSFTVSYFADGKRKLKMFADFDEAHAEASSKAISLSKGELDVLEAAKDYAKRHLHELPNKTVTEAVNQMLEAKQREGASKAYMKVLRFYLG